MKKTIKQILLAAVFLVSIGACKKSGTKPQPVTPVEAKIIDIANLKALSTEATVKLPDAIKITGVVISDASNKNIETKTVVLQEDTDKSGIIINFDAAHAFIIGDQLEVDISNQTLAQINGELVLNNIQVTNAKKTGAGIISAKNTTVSEILKNAGAWDGTLVKIVANGIDGGNGNYLGTLNITDATGSISCLVLPGATFENKTYPNLVGDITGIVRIHNNKPSLNIRNIDDIKTPITRTIVDDNFTKMSYKVLEVPTPNISLISPFPVDNYLDVSKKYYYEKGILNVYGKDLADLREFSFDISYSKFTGDFRNFLNIDDYYNGSVIYPFTNGKDVNQLNVMLTFDEGIELPLAYFKIKDVGVIHTISIQIPQTEPEFRKAFLSSGVQTEDYISFGYEDYFNKNLPKLFSVSISSATSLFSAFFNPTKQEMEENKNINTRNGDSPGTASVRPFAIGKITYGYTK